MKAFIKHIIKYFKKPKTDLGQELEYIYTQTIGGKEVNYYMFKNIFSIPNPRAFYAMVAVRWAELRMTADNMALMVHEAKEANDKGKVSDVGTILNEMLFREENAGEIETALNLACPYVIREDERFDMWDETIQEEKKRDWKADPDALGFFLTLVSKVTNDYSKDSPNHSQQFLEAALMSDQRNKRSSTKRKKQ